MLDFNQSQSTAPTRGGRRPGAGRKKGSLGKRTQEIAAAAIADGLTPLDVMLSIMRSEDASMEMRFKAACEAAPYIHPRLAAVQHSGNDDKPLTIQVLTHVPRPTTQVV
jgi:hypothetical protein